MLIDINHPIVPKEPNKKDLSKNIKKRKKQLNDAKINQLPVLADIFSFFTFKERSSNAIVCKRWREIANQGDYGLYMTVLRSIIPRLIERERKPLREYANFFNISFPQPNTVKVVRARLDRFHRLSAHVSNKKKPFFTQAGSVNVEETTNLARGAELNKATVIKPTGLKFYRDTNTTLPLLRHTVIVHRVIDTVNKMFEKNKEWVQVQYSYCLKNGIMIECPPVCEFK